MTLTVDRRGEPWPGETLASIVEVIGKPRPPERAAHRLSAWADEFRRGKRPYIEDSDLDDMGRHLGLYMGVLPLAAAHLLPPAQLAYFRPKRTKSWAFAIPARPMVDVAGLLLWLREIGLAVDPTPLVDALQPHISKSPRLTESGLRVYWSKRERGTMQRTVSGTAAEATGQSFRTAGGYKVMFATRDGTWLQVTGPRYRRSRER